MVWSFKELKRLDIPFLVNANDEAYDTPQEEAEIQLIVEWSRFCPSLEIVTLPSCMEWHFKHKERLWRRETDDETANGNVQL